jgi:hypothetical protein
LFFRQLIAAGISDISVSWFFQNHFPFPDANYAMKIWHLKNLAAYLFEMHYFFGAIFAGFCLHFRQLMPLHLSTLACVKKG